MLVLTAEADTPPDTPRSSTGRYGPRRGGRVAAIALALVAAVPAVGTGVGTANAAPARPVDVTAPDLGPNVTVFDPSMPVEQIQAKVDEVNRLQIDSEMGSGRYALLFKPGTYGTAAKPLQMKVGYYTEVAGLGASPSDVTINGKIEVYNRCLENGGTSNCLALVNFWRSLSNLTLDINGRGQDGCRASANFWAVSQAAPMRRVDVKGGNLSLMDYCTAGPQFASGGFIADSRAGTIINGSQQQWLTRNSTIGTWSNAVWSAVFSGVEGAPSDAAFPKPPYTTVERTPVSREKPYLFVDDDGAWNVRVPSAQRESRGITWAAGQTPGRTVPLSDFFIAKPGDSVQEINNQLARGKDLLVTPGMYEIDRTIAVRRPDTVVLGLGLATLTSAGGALPMTVADVPGVVIAGLTIDAGPVNAPALLRVGSKNGNEGSRAAASAANPTTLSDVFFRVGGPHVGKVDVALEVNSDHVLIDHTWVWRADHGIEGLPKDTESPFAGNVITRDDDARWVVNTSANGVIVNGDDVTATGLFVEHFQEYNTIWNGERGRTIFYQCELPYDPRSQADWSHDGVNGWAGYKVADGVQEHLLEGGGVYVFNQNNPSILTEDGFEVPKNAGVKLRHVLTVNLSAGTIEHVVNGVGGQVDDSNTGSPQYVNTYP